MKTSSHPRCPASGGKSTSNRAPTDWYGLFPNPVVAEGALDRLVNRAHHVLTGGSQS
jgi:hypothetical protein